MLKFQFRNLIHPCCQPPIKSIFNRSGGSISNQLPFGFDETRKQPLLAPEVDEEEIQEAAASQVDATVEISVDATVSADQK